MRMLFWIFVGTCQEIWRVPTPNGFLDHLRPALEFKAKRKYWVDTEFNNNNVKMSIRVHIIFYFGTFSTIISKLLLEG